MKRMSIIITVLILALVAVPVNAQTQSSGLARIRFMHVAPAAPPVNVWARDSIVTGPLFYPQVSSYTPFIPGTHTFKVITANQQQTVVIETNLSLMGDTDYTVIVLGRTTAIEALVLVDDNTPPEAGQAKVRFIHAAPDAPAVDVATTDGQILFSNVPFKGGGENYISVAGGVYDLQVRPAGSSDVALAIPQQSLPAGTVSTILAIGLANGEPALDAISALDNRFSMEPPGGGYPPYPGYNPCCRPKPCCRPRPCCPSYYYGSQYYYPYYGHVPYGPNYVRFNSTPPPYPYHYHYYNYGYQGFVRLPKHW